MEVKACKFVAQVSSIRARRLKDAMSRALGTNVSAKLNRSRKRFLLFISSDPAKRLGCIRPTNGPCRHSVKPRAVGALQHATSFFIVLFLVGSLAGATPVIATEDTSPPSLTSDPVNVVRQVAKALTAGADAIQDLRGPPIEHSTLDRLKLPTPGMDCGIARSLIYVACHSASMNKTKAEALFAQIMDDVQTALPSDSWRAVEAAPPAGLIRRSSYQHLKSGARIDIDLVAGPGGDAQSVYWVRVYGWNRF